MTKKTKEYVMPFVTVMERSEETDWKDVPKRLDITVGMPCTVHFVTDCYPFEVTRITPSGKTIYIRSMLYRPIETGFDYFSNQVYTYTSIADGACEALRKRKDGRWYTNSGQRVTFGFARCYQDPHF